MRVEAWLTAAARRHADRVALETAERALTYGELDALATAGCTELGASSGARVAIALAPGVDFVVALHACLLAGAVAMPLDPRDPASARRAASADFVLDRPLECRGVARGSAATATAAEHDLDATALIVRTSGTTSGQPKDVELTYGNFLWSAIGSAVALGLDPRERWLCTLPLVHVGGLSIVLRSAIYGTTAVLHERFEAASAAAALMEGEITLVSVVATTLRRLLDAGLREPPALRCALAGGGPVPVALLERARAAGVVVCETYGLTEACSQVATQAPGERTPGAGAPLFCTRVAIGPGAEIVVRGPTLSPTVPGGALATRDVGELLDDGSLRVFGRISETIISGGENVSPSEVEAVLEEHPLVAEAAVFGVADAEWGEAVHAAVVAAGEVAAEELREWCALRLAAFKVPKAMVFLDWLPRTDSGKLQRSRLPVDGAPRRP